MKFSNEEQKLFTINLIGLLLCATAHVLPSGLNFFAALMGLLLICYYLVKSYKNMKKDKNQSLEENNTQSTMEE